jgi:hypothetical protein
MQNTGVMLITFPVRKTASDSRRINRLAVFFWALRTQLFKRPKDKPGS